MLQFSGVQGCFFAQFFTSVAKVDYLTLRHGFVTAHLTPQSQATFNFQKYINRSLEEDFKVLVGISPVIWLSAVLLLLTNTNGWYSQYWVPFIPLIIILLIGAKFQVIITKMGIDILERGVIIKGTPLVQAGDDLFWFSRPRLILFLIHFVLFQNAFQIAFFVWSWYEFGFPSCYHENFEEMIIRITMGVTIQVLCSYVTIPLYALVTQMGSSLKPVIFSQRVASALRTWHQRASKRLKQRRQSGSSTPVDGGASPVHLLREHKKYNDIHKGREGGEGASASPSHRDIDDTMRKCRHLGKTKRNENEISLRNFSFGNKQCLAGMEDGSMSPCPSHHHIDNTARNSIRVSLGQRDDTEISSGEFSFRNKPELSGVSGSKW
ncbi:MLO-like protein 6 [Salvia miltiorrhiza]|uniref:MLO-like protein 6 n=1 Tax=Salvia miltiorrhiza TaxID=226208 RepID=UPI0025AC3D20|nr:MLO-like protein 6 [Salvia miltiorrhiza]